MKNVAFAFIVCIALLLACRVEIPAPLDTTCNVPDAGLTYKLTETGNQAGSSCSFGSFLIGKYFSDNRHILLIQGDRKRLNLSKKEQIFDLSTTDTLALKVNVYKYQELIQYPMFCNDLVYKPANPRIEKWNSVGGKIAIKIETDSIGYEPNKSGFIFYTMRLNVVNCIALKKPNNTIVKIETPILGTMVANF